MPRYAHATRSVFLLALIGSSLATCFAPAASEATAPEKGTAIPDPPQQAAKWEWPKSDVPAEIVDTISLLFDQGMADPRGCEYRGIVVRVGSCWTGDAGVVRTRGWVLPETKEGGRRFAVCWNGLVYPVVSAGEKVDLRAEVKATVQKRNEAKQNPDRQRNRDEEDGPPRGDEGWSLWHGQLGSQDIAMLLRLGEGDLASEVWKAFHADDKGGHGYLSRAEGWGWTQFDRALCAHMRGDDTLAMHGFRKLTAFAAKVRAEAARRGDTPIKDGKADKEPLAFLEQLSDLLNDQERRAKEGSHAPVVCIGPGAVPDAKVRIAALVGRLDEVNARQWGQPGGVSLGSDPVVQALIREGEPALEPLLKCFEVDRRMTRSVHFWRDFSHNRTCLSVHEAAYVAISSILAHSDFSPASTGDNLTSRGEETRQKLAESIREQMKTAKRVPRAERYFNTLADNAAKPREWVTAARHLVSYDDEAMAYGTTVWSGRRVKLDTPEGKGKLVGEPLRARKSPTLTELLRKRIDECEMLEAADLTLTLSYWDSNEAKAPLSEQMRRLREARKWDAYVSLVERRTELADPKALDDYVELLRNATKESLGGKEVPGLISPMMDHPNHPKMDLAAERLFGDSKSPWLPLIAKPPSGDFGWGLRGYELVTTRLLRLPAFRDAVIKELGNRGGNGTIRVDKYGSMSMDLPDVTNSYGGGSSSRELDIPEGGAGDKFRICDFVAWKISEKVPGAPRCELYWPEEKRDKAVAECEAFLRRFGNHLLPDPKSMIINRVATPADIQAGKAIFTLAGADETRVVEGLKLPLEARWTILKHRPYEKTSLDPKTGKKTVTVQSCNQGTIVQAEEVREEGKWRRYYGFVGANRVARVPAEQIEFPPDGDRPWDDSYDWTTLDSGFHAKLLAHSWPVELLRDYLPRLTPATKMMLTLVVRNARGVDQVPVKAADGVRLRLLYSPEVVSSHGSLVPATAWDENWVEVAAKAGGTFKDEAIKPVAPGAEIDWATVDLRAWFDLNKPGFYRVQLLPLREGADKVPSELRFSLDEGSPTPKSK